MKMRGLGKKCEAFIQTLNSARGEDPLDDDFVRRFNGLVAENPKVLYWKSRKGHGRTLLEALYWYLYHAIESFFPLATFQALVIQTLQVLEETDDLGRTLLHWVCVHRPSALDIVSFFTQQNRDTASALDCEWQTPLHFASEERAPLPVIRILVDACSWAVRICDHDGDSPLHRACGGEGAPLDVINYLVAQEPHMCLRRNENGSMPLDVAKYSWYVRNRADVIEFMTTATKAAARALMKRLRFGGPLLPREIFEQVAAYIYSGPVVEVSTVMLALSGSQMAVLFCRDDIQAEFREQL